MDLLNSLTGWSGASLVLFAYFFTLVKDWTIESGRYLLVTCAASVLLGAHAAFNGAWPFVVINAAMLLVVAYKVVREGWPTWK